MDVFLTGATGYIGGSVAAALAERGHRVRGLVRDPGAAGALAALGVAAVPGTLDDAGLLRRECAAADVVVNAADSDHAGAVRTMLDAVAGSGRTFVHTSGSSIVGTAANGEPDPAVYDESVMEPRSSWEPDPYKAPRVAIDRSVLAARGIVLCNTLIYGDGRGLKRDSIQVPQLERLARERGTAVHIGRGENIWSTVHIDDVTALYVAAAEGGAPGGFYFAESGEASFRAIATAIARRLGVGGPEPLDVGSAIGAWGHELAVYALGSNSRVRGRRTREVFDWTPRHTSVVDWIGARPGV